MQVYPDHVPKCWRAVQWCVFCTITNTTFLLSVKLRAIAITSRLQTTVSCLHCSSLMDHPLCGSAITHTPKSVATCLDACHALQYYDDTARVLRSVVLSAIAPHRLTAAPKPMPLAFATPEAAKGVSQGSLLELSGVIAEEGEGMYADSEGDLYERWVLCYAFMPDWALLV